MKLYNRKNRKNIKSQVARNVDSADKPWPVHINLGDQGKQYKQDEIMLP